MAAHEPRPACSSSLASPVGRSARRSWSASKPFGESYILAEMFAQLLEARGIAVDRRLGLGATEIAFGAIRTGAVDVYPEYTGTGLLAILGEQPMADPAAVFDRVSREFRRRSERALACRRSGSRTPTRSRCARRPPIAIAWRR